MKYFIIFCFCFLLLPSHAQEFDHLFSITEPSGELSPKSIRHNGKGVFSAQNMMYNHMISFYDRSFNLLGTLSDSINLAHYGVCEQDSWFRGAPVECDFSPDGRYAFISNYKMYGKGFKKEASDNCSIHSKNERSYLYKIDLQSLSVVQIYEVGSVPKYVKYIDHKDWLAVSNWCSGTISVIDLKQERRIKEIFVGTYPRGIDYFEDHLYVTVMGSDHLAKIDMKTWEKEKIKVGLGPRDLRIDRAGRYAYLTLNNENRIAQLDLSTGIVTQKVAVGALPRSMCLSGDENFIFFTEYGQHQFGTIQIPEMEKKAATKTCYKPIGIEYDTDRDQLWVACYGGQIDVYQVNTTAERTTPKIEEPRKELPIEKPIPIVKSESNKIQLIAGSFSNKNNAIKRQNLLANNGIKSELTSFRGNYRVLAYQGNSLEEADRMKEKIRTRTGLSTWIQK